MAEKTKQPEKAKQVESPVRAEKSRQPAKPNLFQRAKQVSEKDKGDKPNQPNAIVKWWRETLGELRKVSWPTVEDARRLTVIVLVVMVAMAITLGLLDYLFSTLIALLVA